MQELIIFLEKPMQHPDDDTRPQFGSPLKICNSFLNRCAIDENAGIEIQNMNYLINFSEVMASINHSAQQFYQMFSLKPDVRGSGEKHTFYVKKLIVSNKRFWS